MTTRLCEACNEEIGPDGRLVAFVPREADRDWHTRSLVGEVEGFGPDTAWVCGVHALAAQVFAPREEIEEGLRLIRIADFPGSTCEEIERIPWTAAMSIGAYRQMIESSLHMLASEQDIMDQEAHVEERPGEVDLEAFPPHLWPVPYLHVSTLTDGASSLVMEVEQYLWDDMSTARTSVTVRGVNEFGSEWTVAAVPAFGGATITVDNMLVRGELSSGMSELLSWKGLLPIAARW